MPSEQISLFISRLSFDSPGQPCGTPTTPGWIPSVSRATRDMRPYGDSTMTLSPSSMSSARAVEALMSRTGTGLTSRKAGTLRNPVWK